MIRSLASLLLALMLWAALPIKAGDSSAKLTIAAASDLKFAMDELVQTYREAQPTARIDVVYGSSGKFCTQIQQGAPFDLFFSADIAYPRLLAQQGLCASEIRTYAIGRIVLWSTSRDASKLTLTSLTDPKIKRIAIANPKHAPYGKRAQEALQALGLWEQLQPKLVFGENISHTAQLVETQNAEIGIIALSLAVHPKLAAKGGYSLIPADLHQPLEQGFVLTKHGKDNALAQDFATFMTSTHSQAVMQRYGFGQSQAAP